MTADTSALGFMVFRILQLMQPLVHQQSSSVGKRSVVSRLCSDHYYCRNGKCGLEQRILNRTLPPSGHCVTGSWRGIAAQADTFLHIVMNRKASNKPK